MSDRERSKSRYHESDFEKYFNNSWNFGKRYFTACYSILFQRNQNRDRANTDTVTISIISRHRWSSGFSKFRDSISNLFFPFFRRPKLVFDPKMHYAIIHNDEKRQQNSYRITFWVTVFNHGKESARQCRAFIRLTDISGAINMALQMSIPYTQYFQVKWEPISEDTRAESSLDILPSKDASPTTFQVPLE